MRSLGDATRGCAPVSDRGSDARLGVDGAGERGPHARLGRCTRTRWRRALIVRSSSRITLKAGPKLIGVAFVQRTEARDEATLRPRMRSRGTQPAINSVTISGPYNVTGPATRRAAGASSSAVRPPRPTSCPCAQQHPLDARAPRVPPPGQRTPTSATCCRSTTQGRAEGSFDRGIQKALERLLVSPQFLFRIEREPRRRSGRHGLSRQRPRARLAAVVLPLEQHPGRRAARRGSGRAAEGPAVLEQQVRRMLADPRSESLVTNFAAQWLYLRDIEAKQPDEILFPDFDETLRTAMQRETELFVDSVFRENRSVLDLLTRELHVPERAAGAALRRAERQAAATSAASRSRTAACAADCWARAAS